MDLHQAFSVTEVREFKDGDALIARYLPEHSYRVTQRNKAFVEGLQGEGLIIAAGPAQPASGRTEAASGQGLVAGRLTVGREQQTITAEHDVKGPSQ